MKNFLLFIIILFTNTELLSQKTNNYLPKNLNDALNYIERTWSKEDLIKFKKNNEKDAVTNQHFGYGLFLRNNWVRHGNPSFNKYFNNLGIYNPDDISAIVLTCLHGKLNKKDFKLKEQINYYKEYWAKIKEKEDKENYENFVKYKVKDTVIFKFLRGYINDEQKNDVETYKCFARGIILEKRLIDFNLKVKLINSCKSNEIKILQYSNNVNPKIVIMKVKETRWSYYNDWLSINQNNIKK